MNMLALSFKGLEEFKRVRNHIQKFLHNHLDQEEAFLMNVAVNEAINNSMIHGKSTLVMLKITNSDKELVVKIEDNGLHFNGFEYIQRIRESQKDLFQDNLTTEGNRGLLILEEICDDVIYSAERNELLLVKEKS